MKVAVVIPCYNESMTLAPVVAGAIAAAEVDVFVVDDGSTDGSDTIARDAGATVVPTKGREGYESHGEAIYGALLGIKIGIKPLRAITLGPKSEKALKKALALDGENPIAWVEMGNMRYHAPGIFGGSNTEAIRCYKKAIILFDQQEELRTNNWQYLHALAWLGQAYENEGDQELAIESYEKALAVAPAFVWVKDELLPAAKE